MTDFETPPEFENLWTMETEDLVKTIISQHDTLETNQREFDDLRDEYLELESKVDKLEQQIEDLEDELQKAKA